MVVPTNEGMSKISLVNVWSEKLEHFYKYRNITCEIKLKFVALLGVRLHLWGRHSFCETTVQFFYPFFYPIAYNYSFLQVTCVTIELHEWIVITFSTMQVCYSGGGCIHREVHRLQGSQFQHSILL